MSPAPLLPESLPLDHHLAKRIRTAQPSVMKALGKLLADKKGLLSLGGGLPHPSLFPMQHATFTLPTLSSLDGNVAAWQTGTAPTETIHLKKTGPGTEQDQGGVLDLNQVLQYGLSNGFGAFVDQLTELNEALHGRQTADASIYITCGNTDGVSKVWQLLVEPDVDTVLTEDYTFASSLNSGKSKGAKFYPVKTDDNGMVPSDLEAVLSGWNEQTQGRKPHLIYTIPCGQNPTGSIMPPERYDEIYKVCQQHDVIIMEDDPYFPLQYRPYEPSVTKRAAQLQAARDELPPPPSSGKAEDDDLAAVAAVFNDYANVRSYLSRDVDGRVVRIDTFSKVFGPGMRMGWISSNASFAERLMRIGESSTSVPNNLGQAVLASYLSPNHWGVSGFIRWMWAVRLEYQTKRDHFLDLFALHVNPKYASTTPCGGGMFQWIRIHIEEHSRHRNRRDLPQGPTHENDVVPNSDLKGQAGQRAQAQKAQKVPLAGAGTGTGELIDELWQYLINEHNVLLMPAKFFRVPIPGGEEDGEGLEYFRATFAGDLATIEASLRAFGKGVESWFARG